MIRIWFFASIKCQPLRLYCFFKYFLISSLAEVCFAYFWTHYFFSLLPCIPSNKLSFSVLWLQLLFIEWNSWNIVYFIKMSNNYNSGISFWANCADISNRCNSWIRFYNVNCQVKCISNCLYSNQPMYPAVTNKLNTLTMNGLYYFQWIFLDHFSYIEHQYYEYSCDS